MAKEKTTMSVLEMQRMLGLKKTDAYWLVHKKVFDTILVEKKMRVVLASFEKWYANQLRHSKVNGPPPGAELRAYSISVKEMAEFLGVSDDAAYAIIKREQIETFEVEHRNRIRKDVFEKWYQGQGKYRTAENRERDNVSEKQPPLMVVPDKQSYGVRETAVLLRCTEQVIRRMIRAGELEARKYGNRYLIARSEIEWWILQQKLDTER